MKAFTSDEHMEQVFDAGEESVLEYADASSARILEPQIDAEPRALSLSLPSWLMATLDAEATRCGVSRASLIKLWLVERADAERDRTAGTVR